MNRLILLMAFGCAEADDGEVSPPADTAAPPSQSVVVSVIGFEPEEEGVTEGFDLDGEVSTADSPLGCGHADRIDPSGAIGIDNAFADLVPILEATEASALESLLAQSIANGELQVLFELTDPDGACEITLWQGETVPLLGADGVMLSHQTLQVAAPVSAPCVRTADGSFEARGLQVALPVRVLNLSFTLHLADAAVRIAVDDEGRAVGLLAGGIPMSDFEVILAEDNIADLSNFLRPIVTGMLDLYPDETGACTAMSVTLGFDAIPAFLATAE